MTALVLGTVTTLEAPYGPNLRDVYSTHTIHAGDTLIAIVGGGSHVTGHPGDWTVLDDQLGQEAQGFVMVKEFDDEPVVTDWTVQFDGGDKSLVTVIHVRGPVIYELEAADRKGNVGVVRPPETFEVPAGGSGDLEYLFAFARNAGDSIPTADGMALASLDNGNETGALYRDDTPADPRTVNVPSCTGRYIVALNLRSPGAAGTQLPARQIAGLTEQIDAQIQASRETIVIDSTDEFPPAGTPTGTIVFRRV